MVLERGRFATGKSSPPEIWPLWPFPSLASTRLGCYYYTMGIDGCMKSIRVEKHHSGPALSCSECNRLCGDRNYFVSYILVDRFNRDDPQCRLNNSIQLSISDRLPLLIPTINQLPLQNHLRERTPAPNPFSISDEHKRNDCQSHRNECQQRSRPVDPKLAVHGVGGQRQTNRKNRSQGAGGSLSRGGILLVCIGEIIDHRHENEDITHAEPKT